MPRKGLIDTCIEQDPRRAGMDEARMISNGVKVWAVIANLKPDFSNIEDVVSGYDLSPEEVEATIAYYRRHKAVIDNRLYANSA